MLEACQQCKEEIAEWLDISTYEDLAKGIRIYMCSVCGNKIEDRTMLEAYERCAEKKGGNDVLGKA